jgi:hypothetical protein
LLEAIFVAGLSGTKGEYYILCFSSKGCNRLLLLRHPRDWAITKVKNIARVGMSCSNTVSIEGIKVSCESQRTISRISKSVGFGSLKVVKCSFNDSIVDRYRMS